MDTAWFLGALERAGVSQADLARHLRLAPSAVSRMLKGDRQMKLLEAAQTASFLGVSQDEVLRRASGEAPAGSQPEGPRRAGAAAAQPGAGIAHPGRGCRRMPPDRRR